MNDTSIGGVVDANNDRHVFFQDNTGLIRHAWFFDSIKQWKTSTEPVVASNAKNLTPMAAVTLNYAENEFGSVSLVFKLLDQSH